MNNTLLTDTFVNHVLENMSMQGSSLRHSRAAKRSRWHLAGYIALPAAYERTPVHHIALEYVRQHRAKCGTYCVNMTEASPAPFVEC